MIVSYSIVDLTSGNVSINGSHSMRALYQGKGQLYSRDRLARVVVANVAIDFPNIGIQWYIKERG